MDGVNDNDAKQSDGRSFSPPLILERLSERVAEPASRQRERLTVAKSATTEAWLGVLNVRSHYYSKGGGVWRVCKSTRFHMSHSRRG